MNANAEFSALRKIFAKNADPENSAGMKKYMKHKFSFYGIKSPVRKNLQKPFVKKWAGGDKRFIKTLVHILFKDDHREMQYTACDLIIHCKKKLEPNDLEFLEGLLLQKSWWDSVDALSQVIGDLFMRFPELQPGTTDAWMKGDELWLKRVALIHQLKYRENVDWHMLQRYCLDVANSKEFFLQKAAGWALRQYSKFRPDFVRVFISQNELPKITMREASKYV